MTETATMTRGAYRRAFERVRWEGVALFVMLLVAWVNFLGTRRWSDVPGALNGLKRPWYAALLVLCTVLALRRATPPAEQRLPRLSAAAMAGTWIALPVLFLLAFPPSQWTWFVFLDDWPPRLQSTLDGIALLERGAMHGWQWAFLGGYHTSANLSQNLTMLAILPIAALGVNAGFHALHLILTLAVPALLFIDLRREESPSVARTAAALCAACSAGFLGGLLPSGDTNTLAGIACAAAALAASGGARRGSRTAAALLPFALTAAIYSHAAFFIYTCGYLAVEALFYRDWRVARRSAAAAAVAVLAAAPLYFELLAYPGYTAMNNVVFDPSDAGPWTGTLRQIAYNVEFMLQPWRWFNHYAALGAVWLAPIALVAIRRRTRAGFYGTLVIFTTLLAFLDAPRFGFLFARGWHASGLLVSAPIACFILRYCAPKALAVALVATAFVFLQWFYSPVPHVRSVAEFNPSLIARIGELDGNLVLLENSPHRDLDADPNRRTIKSPFPAHFEALLPAATGHRFYGSEWDSWHWSRFRPQVAAGGAFKGRAIDLVPLSEFTAELRKWGIRHLVVWSDPFKAYLRRSERFALRWHDQAWEEFEWLDADPRSVVAESGEGVLIDVNPLGAAVLLDRMRAGSQVVVRTNFYPAWQVSVAAQRVPTYSHDGQLAFRVPADGRMTARLEYPRRPWLLVGALVALIVGVAACGRL